MHSVSHEWILQMFQCSPEAVYVMTSSKISHLTWRMIGKIAGLESPGTDCSISTGQQQPELNGWVWTLKMEAEKAAEGNCYLLRKERCVCSTESLTRHKGHSLPSVGGRCRRRPSLLTTGLVHVVLITFSTFSRLTSRYTSIVASPSISCYCFLP